MSSAVGELGFEQLREALRHWDLGEPSAGRGAAARRLAAAIAAPGALQRMLHSAPSVTRAAFAQLATRGPLEASELLGRPWHGTGPPPPLDWLIDRGLATYAHGMLAPVAQATEAFMRPALDWHGAGAEVSDVAVPADAGVDQGDGAPTANTAPTAARITRAGSVVSVTLPEQLAPLLAVTAARLRAVSPTVAVSPRSPEAVGMALGSAGVGVADSDEAAGPARQHVLPLERPEPARTPRAIREVIEGAVAQRRQLRLHYYASSKQGEATERIVDPWEFDGELLRGWCHLRTGQRAFAVDRIGGVLALPNPIAESAPGPSIPG